MAKTIVQKNISRGPYLGTAQQGPVTVNPRPDGTVAGSEYAALGSITFWVTGGDTLSGTDFQFIAENGDTLTFTPKKITNIKNMAGTVTIAGQTYAADNWEVGDMGGIPCGAAIAIGSGNVLITLSAA